MKYTKHSLMKLVLLFLLSVAVFAQGRAKIEFVDHRPLAALADELEKRFGFAVNYEDPPYPWARDLEDVSTPQQRAQSPGYQLMAPKKSKVAIVEPDSSNLATLALALQEAITSARSTGAPGGFVLNTRNESFDLVPNQAMDENGTARSVDSILLTKVSIPYSRKSVPEHIEEILATLGKLRGVRIQLGAALFRPSLQVDFGVNHVSARDALGQLLSSATKAPISYRLLYDVNSRAYMMNLQAVKNQNRADTLPGGRPDPEAQRIEALKRWGVPSKP